MILKADQPEDGLGHCQDVEEKDGETFIGQQKKVDDEVGPTWEVQQCWPVGAFVLK